MKRLWLVVGLWMVGQWTSPARAGEVSFGVFYSSLASEGEWISCDADVYAWKPSGVPPGWRPYYAGRWCWTDDGWYWASDEPWAWATYHYGRWYYDDVYGWLWVPGYDWAPAWVEWQYGGDCVGWAPLSPYAVFNVGFGVRYRSSWITPRFWWSFVDCRHFAYPDVHRYVYRSEENGRYFGRTRPAGSVRYDGGRIVSRGPGREYIEERGRTRIERTEIREVTERPTDRLVKEAGRERVDVYRPRIETRHTDLQTVRPERIRQSEHRVFPDTRGLDVLARDIDREQGRNPSRTQDTRAGVQVQRERPVPGGRNDRPAPGRERRSDQRRGGEPGGMQQRHSGSGSVHPEGRSRRPDAPHIDRSPVPRRDGQQGNRGRGSDSRGGGRRK